MKSSIFWRGLCLLEASLLLFSTSVILSACAPRGADPGRRLAPAVAPVAGSVERERFGEVQDISTGGSVYVEDSPRDHFSTMESVSSFTYMTSQCEKMNDGCALEIFHPGGVKVIAANDDAIHFIADAQLWTLSRRGAQAPWALTDRSDFPLDIGSVSFFQYDIDSESNAIVRQKVIRRFNYYSKKAPKGTTLRGFGNVDDHEYSLFERPSGLKILIEVNGQIYDSGLSYFDLRQMTPRLIDGDFFLVGRGMSWSPSSGIIEHPMMLSPDRLRALGCGFLEEERARPGCADLFQIADRSKCDINKSSSVQKQMIKNEKNLNVINQYVGELSGVGITIIPVACSEKLAIIFPGGPGRVPATLTDYITVQRYLQHGYNVALVTGSGQVGAGLSVTRSVADEGVGSFHDDAKIIEEWVNGQASIERVVIHGESFGALGAYALSSEMNDRGEVNLVLITPFFKPRDPAEYIPKQRRSYQREFEHYFLGIRDQTDRNLFYRNIQMLPCPKADDVYIYFAIDDPVSRPSDLIDCLEGVNIRKLKGSHRFLPSNETIWKELNENVL